jgi:poly(ADP-ribose) glycohydrolase ARH3
MTLPLDNLEGALVGTMTGDSMGFGFDGLDAGPLHHRFPTVDTLRRSEPGRYGAATEMMTATAESLAAASGFDAADMATRLALEASGARGYGAGTLAVIERLRAGEAWHEAARARTGRSSFGNGAAVRVAPLGVVFHDDLEQLRFAAEEAALITHPHALAAEGAVLHAIGVAVAASAAGQELSPEGFLLSVGREATMREYRTRYEIAAALTVRETEWKRVVERLGNTQSALGSVVTAAYCFARSPASFEETVAFAVYLAGNTASIAAMAGALSGAYLGYRAIPIRWVEKLERGPVSPERLRGLAQKLKK